jgi:hypothetical protein
VADLGAIRQGLADAISGLDGIGQVKAYMLANPTPPAAQIVPGQISYDEAMARGLDLHVFLIQLFVAEASGDIGSQQRLDAFLAGSGSASVKEAVEVDVTLGGVCETLRVVEVSGYRRFTFEGRPPLLGAEWTVQVYAQGN